MFYITGIDISSDKQMFNFLKDHFQYYTMNSWNRLKSIAHNVKIYNLKLSGDHWTALTFLQDDDYFVVNMMIEDWEAEHPGYKVGFNGRSGGYLVLYSDSSNCCVLPEDVDECESYEEYKRYCREYYGSVKANRWDLVRTVKLVQDFDRLCDDLRELVNEYSKLDYDNFVLAGVIDRFNERYYEDLEYLEFAPLTISTEGVDISSIQQLDCLVEALLRLFGENRDRVEINDFILRIKED
jgi:hypothetical protein